jgi:hypothetical protein
LPYKYLRARVLRVHPEVRDDEAGEGEGGQDPGQCDGHEEQL